MKTALERAIDAAGGRYRLAKAIGVKPPTIFSWQRSKNGHIPAKRVLAVVAASGIPAHELRPDLYPAPPAPDARILGDRRQRPDRRCACREERVA